LYRKSDSLRSYLVTKTGQTLLVMIGFCVPNIVGTIVLLTVAPTNSNKAGLVVAFYCMQCFQAVSEAKKDSVSSGEP
jgi:hypothetical protein